MKLKTKIVLIFVAIVAALGAVSYLTISANLATKNSYQNLLATNVQSELLIGEIDRYMLNARRSEKDFLARMDLEYVEKVKEHVGSVIRTAEHLAAVAGSHEDEGTEGAAEDIITSIAAYEQVFLNVSESWTQKSAR